MPPSLPPQETAFDVAASAEQIGICDLLIRHFESLRSPAPQNAKGAKDRPPPPKFLSRTTGIEIVYENQRAGYVGEYSRLGLYRTDTRGPFSNPTHQPVNFNDIKLPDRFWFWLTDWTVDKSGNVDDGGWEVLPPPLLSSSIFQSSLPLLFSLSFSFFLFPFAPFSTRMTGTPRGSRVSL